MHHTPIYIFKALQQRVDTGNKRFLTSEALTTDFYSNDYLGLARNLELAKVIEDTFANLSLPNKNGSTGSRLISGNTAYIEEVESYLANIFKSESCLLFNSGYSANLGVLSSIPQKGDTILYDELSHSSIKDGIRLSFAERFSFKHNDLTDLEKKLQKASGEKYIVVESIYSMDGDTAPLVALTEICKKHNAYLIVDEAHSTGIMGENGSGLVCQLNLQDKVFLRIHTFGKAMGAHGACIAASDEVRNFLINFSRPFIYTTAMPLHEIVTIKCAFDYLASNISLQSDLAMVIALFKNEVGKLGLKNAIINSDSAIQALIIPGNAEVKALAGKIQKAGCHVKPILSPTVKAGQERLRICLHSYNTEDEINTITALIK